VEGSAEVTGVEGIERGEENTGRAIEGDSCEG
jgi:hypothetical protein